MWDLWEASNGKFSVVSKMRGMDPWKMRESKEGDPEVWKRFSGVEDASKLMMD